MKAQYERLIAHIDRALSTLRAAWLYAETPAHEAKITTTINELLDDRLQLMALRDAATA